MTYEELQIADASASTLVDHERASSALLSYTDHQAVSCLDATSFSNKKSKEGAARRGRPSQHIVLTENEQAALAAVTRHDGSTRMEIKRASAILHCADGRSDVEIGELVGANPHSVGKWRKCFLDKRLNGIDLLPRSGRPKQIDEHLLAEVIRLTLAGTIIDETLCSTRKLAKQMDVSNTSIAHIWKMFGLKPRSRENFSLLNDSVRSNKLSNVVGLFIGGGLNALILGTSAKLPWQTTKFRDRALRKTVDTTRRSAVGTLRHEPLFDFAMLALKSARSQPPDQAEDQLLDLLGQIEGKRSDKTELNILLERHTSASAFKLHRWMSLHPHWHFHFVTSRANWLDQTEQTFNMLFQGSDGGELHDSLLQLADSVGRFVRAEGALPTSFSWGGRGVTV